MATHDQMCRRGAHLLLLVALGIPSMAVGCAGGGDAPAPVNAAQEKKVQNYMSSYGEQIRADNKAKAKGKAAGKVAEKVAEKAAEKQSP
jgi:hypothetical protein